MSESLHRQLIAAFALMTIIPTLCTSYFLVVYLMPSIITRENIFLVILVSLILSFLGFTILNKTAKSISKLRQYIETVASGNLAQSIEIHNGTEVDSIGESISFILQKLRQDHQELEQFSEQLEKKVKQSTGELREAREEGEKAKDYTDNIIKNMIDTLIVVDPEGKIKTVNPSTLKVLGYKKEDELIGKPVVTIFAEEEEEEEEVTPFKGTRMKKLIEEGSIRDYEMTYKTKSGKKIPVSFSGSVMRDKEGELVGIVGVARDITERKQAQEQLLHSERLAAVGELAAGIAHEIRNPLGNITASAQFCLSKYKLNEQTKKYLELILRNSESANRIIKELLDFAKPSEISLKSGDIGEVINKACSLVKARCSNQGVRLTRRCSRRLPQILLDEKQLEEAFLNFILNALDAMPNGGRLVIAAYPDSQNNEVVLSFSDTGNGIPEENLNKIFIPFFTTRKDGIGLGLSLAHQVISYHQGKVNIESKVGRGTEVVVRLPVSRRRQKFWGVRDGKKC